MGHDASKVVFGVTDSSDRSVVDFDQDPASLPAGIACRLKSDGTLTTTAADGAFFGVSAGKSLSDHKKTSIIKSGNRVPVKLNKVYGTGTITITSYANLVDAGDDEITVGSVVFVAKASPDAESLVEFAAITSNGATRDALLAKIQAHPDLEGVVTAAASSTAAILLTEVIPGSAPALTYSDEGSSTVGATVSGSGTLANGVAVSSYAAPGKTVYIDDSTGKADVTSGSTITSALYVSGELTGINEDGTEEPAVLIDMGGGL